jgi:hypothetical protein
MSERFWICIYNDEHEGIRGVAGEATGVCQDDVPLLLGTEDLIAEVFNPDLGTGMWVLAGSVTVTPLHRGDPDLDYLGDPNSPAPDWRRLTPDELAAIAMGSTPAAFSGWLQRRAWAE